MTIKGVDLLTKSLSELVASAEEHREVLEERLKKEIEGLEQAQLSGIESDLEGSAAETTKKTQQLITILTDVLDNTQSNKTTLPDSNGLKHERRSPPADPCESPVCFLQTEPEPEPEPENQGGIVLVLPKANYPLRTKEADFFHQQLATNVLQEYQKRFIQRFGEEIEQGAFKKSNGASESAGSDHFPRDNHLTQLVDLLLADFSTDSVEKYGSLVQCHRNLIQEVNEKKVVKKLVVEIVADSEKEIKLSEAKEINPKAKIGEYIKLKNPLYIPDLRQTVAEEVAVYRVTGLNLKKENKAYVQGVFLPDMNFQDLTLSTFPDRFVECNGRITPQTIVDDICALVKDVLPDQAVPVNTGVTMPLWQSLMRKAYGALSVCDFFGPDVRDKPSVRSRLTWRHSDLGEKATVHLRYPNPIYCNPVTRKVEVVPEYEIFLEREKTLGRGVLYGCYQRHQDSAIVENEGVRVQALIQLEKYSNFCLICHSVENKLFENSEGLQTFSDLKNRLIDSFYKDDESATDNPNANRLPEILQKNPVYRNKMEKMFDEIHAIFFEGKEMVDLTPIDFFEGSKKKPVSEWQVCIMLFYALQRETIKYDFELAKEYPIMTEVNPCKDNFDRGGAQNIVTDLLRLTMVYKDKIPPTELENIIYSILAPPLMGKGQGAISYRINPALAVCDLISKLNEKTKGSWIEKLENFFLTYTGGWGLEKFDTSVEEPLESIALDS